MPIFKPETDQDLLKELESIENLCARALTAREGAYSTGLPDIHNVGAMDKLLKNVLRRAQNCQAYVRNQIIDTNGQF